MYHKKPENCTHSYIGDGQCDGMMNNEEKCFDGGDCCMRNKGHLFSDNKSFSKPIKQKSATLISQIPNFLC